MEILGVARVVTAFMVVGEERLRRTAQRVGEEIADLQIDGRVGSGYVGGQRGVVRWLSGEVGVEHLSRS